MSTQLNLAVEALEVRHGTAAEWAQSVRILRVGELGAESDTRKMKLGDGVSLWNQLPYYVTNETVSVLVANAIATTPSIGQADLDQVTAMVLEEIELPDLVLLWENAKA
jgi:hypothetical protein